MSNGRPTKSNTWLAIAAAAFFGVQAPLCASACSASPPDEETGLQGQHHASESEPCHGVQPTRSPILPADHPNCGCEHLQISAWKADIKAVGDSPERLPLLFPVAARSSFFPQFAAASHFDRRRGPPPPNFLLLKSSFLL